MSFGKTVYKWVTHERQSILVAGEYAIKYEKGTIVQAVTNSQGLMCFKTKIDAYCWMNSVSHCTIDFNSAILIKCQPLTKVYKPKYYNCYYGTAEIKHVCSEIQAHGLAPYWRIVNRSRSFSHIINKYNVLAIKTLKVLS